MAIEWCTPQQPGSGAFGLLDKEADRYDSGAGGGLAGMLQRQLPSAEEEEQDYLERELIFMTKDHFDAFARAPSRTKADPPSTGRSRETAADR